MKNKRQIITLLLLLWLGQIEVLSQNREVIWVHGYRDTNSFWAGYEQYFNGLYQIRSTNDKLYSNSGIKYMTSQIQTRISNAPNTIVVGHSMGGVASAALTKTTRGVITVGAPLNGAPITDALLKGQVQDEAGYAIKELSAGPVMQSALNMIIVALYATGWKAVDLGSVVKDNINALFPGISNGFTDQSFEDMRPGSAYMNNYYRYNSQVPKISIWGNEESPVHYRLASTKMYNNDAKLVTVMNTAKDVYWSNYFLNNPTPIEWVASPETSYLRSLLADAWKRGYDYINTSETTWKYLIGATRPVTKTYQRYVMTKCGGNDLARVMTTLDECWEWQTYTVTTYELIPSDGLIGEDSQTGYYDSNWVPDKVEARGVNHLEMGSHPRIKELLTDTWKGLHGGNNYLQFIISPK